MFVLADLTCVCVCVCVCVRVWSGFEINDSTRETDTCFTLQQMVGPSSLHTGEGVCVCVCVCVCLCV